MEKEDRTHLGFIICNKEFRYLPNRDGSEIDLLNMKDLLEDLGYSVIIKESHFSGNALNRGGKLSSLLNCVQSLP